METKTKHTPTPWHIEGQNVVGPSGLMTVHVCSNGRGGNDQKWRDEGNANMEFIIRACNSHDDLVVACKAVDDAKTFWELGHACELAHAALALTEGGAK